MKWVPHIQVFLASPSDVAEERELVQLVIDEINASVGRESNYYIELLTWENSVYPAMGEDAQSVINNQIGSLYDVFIGLMWKRFGQPTKRADSGTSEEYSIALDRFLRTQDVEILWYFKSAPFDAFKEDLVQLGKVQSFQKQLQEDGALYKLFSSSDEFKTMLRLNLSQLISRKFLPRIAEDTSRHDAKESDSLRTKNEVVRPEKIDYGLLDGMELFFANAEKLETKFAEFGNALNIFGVSMNLKTLSLEQLPTLTPQQQLLVVKKLTNEVAQELNEIGERGLQMLEATDPLFTSLVASAKPLLSDSHGLILVEQRAEITNGIEGLKEVLTVTIGGLLPTIDQILAVPEFTNQFKQARDKAVQMMRALDASCKTYISELSQLEE